MGRTSPASGAGRRRFASDLAVSPVISTILMVAITVVLAATAFVLVADIGGNSAQTAPAIGIRPDESLDRLSVTTAQGGADWGRLAISIKSNAGGGTVYVGSSEANGFHNEVAADTGGAIAGRTNLAASASPVSGGDYIEFCRSGGTASSVTFTIIDVNAEQVLGEYTFSDIRAC